ncbi:MAG TPA: extracellular solute-binding protein [Acidimicrobiales bacterium]
MTTTSKPKNAVRKRFTVLALAASVASLSGVVAIVAASGAASNPGFVLYSSQGYDHASVAAFNATNPGFTVTLNDNSTGPLLQQIQAEGSNPKWGVLWVDGASAFAQLDGEGKLLHHSVPKVKFNSLGLENIPADGSFTPTGLTVTGALCYDSSQITAAQLPSTWQQLASSQYKGLVGMNDPSQSGPTFPMIAGIMSYLGKYKSGSTTRAVTAGEAFYTSLKANGLVVNAVNGATITAMEAHTISMATIQSSACYGAALTTFPSMKVTYLNPSIALPSVIGIDGKQPKLVRQDAQKFVDWVLSPAGQAVMQTGDPEGDSLFWPVITGESPSNPIIPPLSSTHAISTNPYTWGKLETQVNTWFDSNIVSGL